MIRVIRSLAIRHDPGSGNRCPPRPASGAGPGPAGSPAQRGCIDHRRGDGCARCSAAPGRPRSTTWCRSTSRGPSTAVPRPILGACKPRRPETRSTSMSSRRWTDSGARGTAPSRPSAARSGPTSTPGPREAGKGRSPTGSTRPTSSRGDGARMIRSRPPDRPPRRLPQRRLDARLQPRPDRSFRSWASGPSKSTSAAAWCSRRSTCVPDGPAAQGGNRARRCDHRRQRRFHHRSRSACRDHPQGGAGRHAGRPRRPHRQANARQGRRQRTDRGGGRPSASPSRPPPRCRRACWA